MPEEYRRVTTTVLRTWATRDSTWKAGGWYSSFRCCCSLRLAMQHRRQQGLAAMRASGPTCGARMLMSMVKATARPAVGNQPGEKEVSLPLNKPRPADARPGTLAFTSSTIKPVLRKSAKKSLRATACCVAECVLCRSKRVTPDSTVCRSALVRVTPNAAKTTKPWDAANAVASSAQDGNSSSTS